MKEFEENLGLKTPQELKDEYEKLEASEQALIGKQYELFGAEIIREQAADYKSTYADWLKVKDVGRKSCLKHTLIAMERWFENKMPRWTAAEISGTEQVRRLQQDVENGVTGCRSLSYKGGSRRGDIKK